jgi:hypothetical protein
LLDDVHEFYAVGCDEELEGPRPCRWPPAGWIYLAIASNEDVYMGEIVHYASLHPSLST